MTNPTITNHPTGIIINIPNEHLKQCFEIDADGEFKIEDLAKYKEYIAKELLEEDCPHTGAAYLDVMLTKVNNFTMETDEAGTAEVGAK